MCVASLSSLSTQDPVLVWLPPAPRRHTHLRSAPRNRGRPPSTAGRRRETFQSPCNSRQQRGMPEDAEHAAGWQEQGWELTPARQCTTRAFFHFQPPAATPSLPAHQLAQDTDANIISSRGPAAAVLVTPVTLQGGGAGAGGGGGRAGGWASAVADQQARPGSSSGCLHGCSVQTSIADSVSSIAAPQQQCSRSLPVQLAA